MTFYHHFFSGSALQWTDLLWLGELNSCCGILQNIGVRPGGERLRFAAPLEPEFQGAPPDGRVEDGVQEQIRCPSLAEHPHDLQKSKLQKKHKVHRDYILLHTRLSVHSQSLDYNLNFISDNLIQIVACFLVSVFVNFSFISFWNRLSWPLLNADASGGRLVGGLCLTLSSTTKLGFRFGCAIDINHSGILVYIWYKHMNILITYQKLKFVERQVSILKLNFIT